MFERVIMVVLLVSWVHLASARDDLDTCLGAVTHKVSPSAESELAGEVNGSRIRNERFLHVPFCQSDCDSWWSACKDDYACIPNWDHGFNWTSGINVCPTGSTCRPFTAVYVNSTNFCQTVWGESFSVVKQSGVNLLVLSNSLG